MLGQLVQRLLPVAVALPALLGAVAGAEVVATSAPDPFEAGAPFVRAFQVEDGLPQSTVHALMLGRQGLLWAGTQDGVARYDGRAWNELELPTRSRSNFVRALLETADGAVWVGTQSAGLLRLQDDSWAIFPPAEGALPAERVNALAESPGAGGSLLWIATHTGGLARFDGRGWKVWTQADGLPSDRVWDLELVEEPDGPRLWLATEEGPAFLVLPDGPIVVPAGRPTESASSVEALPGQGGRPIVWFGLYGGGLASYGGGEWRRWGVAEGLPSPFVTDLARRPDDPGALWIATDGGGLALLEGERLVEIHLGPRLSSKAVYKVLETTSAEGAAGVWIGTRNNGLLRMTPGYWRSFVPFPEIPRSAVSALLVREHGQQPFELWLGTDGFGLAAWRGGAWRRFSRASGDLGHDSVLALAETRAVGEGTRIWAGTRNGGLSMWDGGRWRRFDRAGGALPNDLVQSLAETVDDAGRGTLWVGTREGLARFDGSRWTRPDAAEGLPASSVLALLPDRDPGGRASLWIGTSTGLHRWRDGSARTRVSAEDLPNPTVHALHLRGAANGARELWVGTDGGGGVVLDPDDDLARPRPLSEIGIPPLPNGVVYAIEEDFAGRLYLPTNRGVVRVTPNRNPTEPARLELLTVDHGLPSNQANRGAAAVDSKGRVWVGTISGAAALDPAREPSDATAKRLLLSATLVHGDGQLVGEDERLPYDANRLVFRYTLLSFFGEPLTRYRTQLVGSDPIPTAWTSTGEREFASLAPGEYVFRVWGRDASGIVSGPAKLAFAIEPAPWQTIWARLVALAVLALGMLGIVMARARVHERRERDLEQLVAGRTARLQRANALLIELSYVDALTAVPNRRRFDELLAAEWKRSVRARTPLALVMIDIDRFKGFNDSQGHQRGDECLRQVAAALADGLARTGDAIARYGGEEFAVILPATETEGAARVADQLRRRVQALGIRNEASEVAGVVTVSCGVAAAVPEPGGSPLDLVLMADRALYNAKNTGRNRVVVG